MRATHTEQKNQYLQHMLQARESRGQMFFWMQQTGITEGVYTVSTQRNALEQRLTALHASFNTNPRLVLLAELQNLYQEFRHNYTQAAALLNVTDSYEQAMGHFFPTPSFATASLFPPQRHRLNSMPPKSCSSTHQKPRNP